MPSYHTASSQCPLPNGGLYLTVGMWAKWLSVTWLWRRSGISSVIVGWPWTWATASVMGSSHQPPGGSSLPSGTIVSADTDAHLEEYISAIYSLSSPCQSLGLKILDSSCHFPPQNKRSGYKRPSMWTYIKHLNVKIKKVAHNLSSGMFPFLSLCGGNKKLPLLLRSHSYSVATEEVTPPPNILLLLQFWGS